MYIIMSLKNENNIFYYYTQTVLISSKPLLISNSFNLKALKK